MALLGEFALRLASAFRTWTSPTGEKAIDYFSGNRSRHRGDEISLRASLISDHILQQGFGYQIDQIQIEAVDRADLVLFAGTPRRAVAIIETKRSGFGDLLTTVQSGGETPPQQLERYVRLRGLYLGMLTDGDIWHILDFGTGLEPRASFSLTELVTRLSGIVDAAGAAKVLDQVPALRDALLITQRIFDATAWEVVDQALQQLNDLGQFHSVPLNNNDRRHGLVRQITQELHILRDTIAAQFALLQANLIQYHTRLQQVSATDNRPFTEALTKATAVLLNQVPEGSRGGFTQLIDTLVTGFLDTGDVDGTFAAYTIQGRALAAEYQKQLALIPEVAPVGETQVVTFRSCPIFQR